MRGEESSGGDGVPPPMCSSAQHLVLYRDKPLKTCLFLVFFLQMPLFPILAACAVQRARPHKPDRVYVCVFEHSDFLPVWFTSVIPLWNRLNF